MFATNTHTLIYMYVYLCRTFFLVELYMHCFLRSSKFFISFFILSLLLPRVLFFIFPHSLPLTFSLSLPLSSSVSSIHVHSKYVLLLSPVHDHASCSSRAQCDYISNISYAGNSASNSATSINIYFLQFHRQYYCISYTNISTIKQD